MTDIILHHFDASPFAEKIRLALGLKGLAWHSVEIPMVMPKPDLTALTGGYRKTPVMQVGSDIYCDTRHIAAELERRHPEPSLFPGGSRGIAMALGHWSDGAVFQPGAGLSLGTNEDLPTDILQDRLLFFDFIDIDTLPTELPHLYAQLRAQFQLVEDMLADGRPYLSGAQPGWADILAWFPLWMCRGNVAGTAALVDQLPALLAWERRMAAIGYGEPAAMTAEAALAVARETQPRASAEVAVDAWPRLTGGETVTVTPEDYGAVPVTGELLRLTHTDIAVRRQDARAGELVVHFPRIGYRVAEAA